MNLTHFEDHDVQLGRLVRVHGFAKPDWVYLALAGMIMFYTLVAFVATLEPTRLLLGLGLALGVAAISVCRVPKRVALYEYGMIVESPLFYSTRTVLYAEVRNVTLVHTRAQLVRAAVDVEIELVDGSRVSLGAGVEDAKGIANAVSYQRGLRPSSHGVFASR